MVKWWQKEIVYQIYPKSFQDSNSDGIGDLQGVISRLDYLKKLGITMLWLSPIYRSPMADNGYDISDYKMIDPSFGKMDDLKHLLAEAKKRGIKIILDLVVNHTSDEHPWFQAALADRHSKYRDYYIFKEGKKRPNNWRSIFGGSVWEKIPNEDTYYYHTFHKKQPDLNWENPTLRAEIYEMVNWWLDLGIAGFRVDAITFIKKDLTFKSLPADGVDGLAKCSKASRNRPGIEQFLHELNERCFIPHDSVTVAEAPGVSYDQLDEFIGPQGFFSMIFDFQAADLDVASGSEWFKPLEWTKAELFNKLKKSQLAIQQVGWGAPFIENHDQNRAPSKYLRADQQDKTAVKALGVMYFFLYGTPFIYQGQELGMINSKREQIEDFEDVSSVDQYQRAQAEGLSKATALDIINYRSRDNARNPMCWDDSKYQGFSTVEPWLPQAGEVASSVLEQDDDPTSVLNFYRQMIAFRKQHDVLALGEIEFIGYSEPNVLAYRRYDAQSSFIILVNLSKEVVELPYKFKIKKVMFENTAVIPTKATLKLPEYAAVVIEEDLG